MKLILAIIALFLVAQFALANGDVARNVTADNGEKFVNGIDQAIKHLQEVRAKLANDNNTANDQAIAVIDNNIKRLEAQKAKVLTVHNETEIRKVAKDSYEEAKEKFRERQEDKNGGIIKRLEKVYEKFQDRLGTRASEFKQHIDAANDYLQKAKTATDKDERRQFMKEAISEMKQAMEIIKQVMKENKMRRAASPTPSSNLTT